MVRSEHALAEQLSRTAAQVEAYRAQGLGPGATTDAFEHVFFDNLVVVLENCFMHRGRGQEGKDGNPLNEVRMLAASLTGAGETLAEDRSIRYRPEKAVLGLAVGDRIRLTEKDFTSLAEAYFAELVRRFPAQSD